MTLKFSIAVITVLLFTKANAQVTGCNDPLATNYNAATTVNDGSCIYSNATVTPAASFDISDTLLETSGLVFWNDHVWTHNDNSDVTLYALDTTNGNIVQSCSMQNVVNNDWEDISQDSNYIYIGDFGNNFGGNRQDLHILRVAKDSLCTTNSIIDTIFFNYEDQTDFTATTPNNTDFDCESFIVGADSIYMFTKQWITQQTSVYTIPKTPGNHIAQLKSTYDVNGLVTGATYLEDKNLIALCGYSLILQPFLLLLYDYHDHEFFSGNKRKISINLPFHQTEGIATNNGLKYYLSNEYFSNIVTTPQKLHVLNLETYLQAYLNPTSSSGDAIHPTVVSLFPNPFSNDMTITANHAAVGNTYQIVDVYGRIIKSGTLSLPTKIDSRDIANGFYFLKIDKGGNVYKLLKQ